MSEVWRVFVVEGEESLNRSLVNSLHKDGYSVQGVMNGADAVRVLWAEEYDVVICDLKTPGADGFELLQWLRAYRPSTRMVIVGAADSADQRLQALESGAASFLEKPLDLHVLKDELRRLLQQSGFSASLDSFDLLDVIQIITMSRKSIALMVNTGLEERGTLIFQNGELVWAEYGILRGEEAFFALAAHKNGTVTQQVWNESVTVNVTQPLSRLIFQALQYRTKYADRWQYSGEMDAVSLQSVGTASDSEIDDSPFVFTTDPTRADPVTPAPPPSPAPAPVVPRAPQPAMQQDLAANQSNAAKEWWEKTGRINRVDSDNVGLSGIRDSTPALPPTAFEENAFANEVIPGMPQMPPVSPRVELPSWLTDQPTAAHLPNVRPSAFNQAETKRPTNGGRASSPEWEAPQASPRTTGPIAPQSSSSSQWPPLTESEVKPSAVIDWQQLQSAEPAPVQAVEQEQSRPSIQSSVEQPVKAATSGQLPTVDLQESSPRLSTATIAAQRAARRNYTALVSALQTLGYSIVGFVAAAVVSVEGQPIAQVAIDDLDVAKFCKLFSTIQKHVLQTFEQSTWGEYENTILTSADSHILMRLIGNDKKAFQVLVTTRETNPMESLEVMANVEGAISAALR